jgi:hypothetical protein
MFRREDLSQLHGLSREEKFCEAIQQLNDKFNALAQPDAYNQEGVFDYYGFMMSALGIAKALSVEELASWELPAKTDGWQTICEQFYAQVIMVQQQFLFEIPIRSIFLDASTRTLITHLLSQAKEAIKNATITTEKRDRLLSLIKDLQMEIDRERPPLHAIGEYFVTLCSYLGDGASKLEPAVGLLERVAKAIGDACEAATLRLPSNRKPKQLEPPKKNGKAVSKMDDDMPF